MEALPLRKSSTDDRSQSAVCPRTTAQPIELQTFFYSVTGEKAENKYKKIIGKKEAFIVCHYYKLRYIQPIKILLIPILPFPPF